MENGVFEEHKVHALARIVDVVFSKILSEFLRQVIKIIDSQILLLCVAVITKYNLFEIGLFPFKLEVVSQVALNYIEKPRSILFVNQSIVEDTLRFMNP